jgi:hypothetical protein
MSKAIAVLGIWGSLAVMSFHVSEAVLVVALIVGMVSTFLAVAIID